MAKNDLKKAIDTDLILEIHSALLDISGVINRPQQDEAMIRESGILLDRALFPLLMRIGKSGPIGVVDLADSVGRDHTTVSRQVTKLEQLGLIKRCANAGDRRIREAVLSSMGKKMTNRVDTARIRLGREIFNSWNSKDISELARLSRKLADSFAGYLSSSITE